MSSRSTIDIMRIIIMGITTFFDYLFGGCDAIFITLVTFITLDYVTGVCSAYMSKKISSHLGAKGIFKKFGILCVIALTTIIDKNIFNTSTLRDAVILYYISNEGISILENVCKLGVPVPDKLKSVLQAINSNADTK